MAAQLTPTVHVDATSTGGTFAVEDWWTTSAVDAVMGGGSDHVVVGAAVPGVAVLIVPQSGCAPVLWLTSSITVVAMVADVICSTVVEAGLFPDTAFAVVLWWIGFSFSASLAVCGVAWSDRAEPNR